VFIGYSEAAAGIKVKKASIKKLHYTAVLIHATYVGPAD
jgi:hypothetical protein